MTDKEILQGIDRLDAELPFDEICVGGKDNWHDIDVHEMLYEVKERITWHYPSKGELPPRREQVLCWLWNGNYVLAFKREDDEWTTNGRFTFDGVKCWQYITPPKEEATKQCTNCGYYKSNVCERTKTHPNKPKEWTCLDWKEEA